MLTVDYDRLAIRPGDRLLDVGCGAGRHALEAARRGAHAVALDRGAGELLATLRGEAEVGEMLGPAPGGPIVAVRGDVTGLPFADASFDQLIAAEVLEHVFDDDAAIAELARVLRPGGTLAVTVPRRGPERVCWALSTDYHNVEGGHLRIYRADRLRALVAGAGLRPCGSHHAHALHTAYWWLRCAVGVDRQRHPMVRAYHAVLVWDLMRRPWITRAIERALNPLLGKSVVLYFQREAAASPGQHNADVTASVIDAAA